MRKALTNRDDFELWLFHMTDDIEEFINRHFSQTEQNTLNYSVDSLNIIEEWILSHYKSKDDMLASSESKRVDGAAKYIGETFRKAIGGRWDIELENEKKAFFGLPTIAHYKENATPYCPHALATATADRRRGNYLATILSNAIEDLGI